MKFSELDLHPQVLKGVKNAGFEACMPVQEKVLPISMAGSDVMVQSKTGSGKTAVFVLTFLEEFLRKQEKGKKSQCLIISPTRELALQIAEDAQVLCSGIPGFHIGCFYGGVGYERQEKLLEMGCDMYVGTPGRIIDFIQSKKLNTSTIDTFVIDEADRLFDMGFYPDLKKIFRALPPKENRQTMLFSATLEMRVRELAWEYMNEQCKEVELEPETVTVDKITQELYHVAKSDKFMLFLQLLKQLNPKSALVFTNSRLMTMELSKRLEYNGYVCGYLSGDLPQKVRQKTLENMKEGKIQILVATDVAARGIQIDNLPLVVNYDIPEDYANYVHRIGRTARAGQSGKAITFADEEFVYGLESIEKFIKMKIPVIWPDNLPEVEDLSIGKPWRSEQKKKAPQKSAGNKKTSTKKPSVKNKNSEKTDYKKLSQMSEAERMAYYSKKYGFEPAAKKTAAKKTTAEKPKAKTEEKKTGFFARLFGKRKNG